jgi:hypothetical protein
LIYETSSRLIAGIATTKGRAAAKATRLFRLGAIVVKDAAKDGGAELMMDVILYDLYTVLYRNRSRVRED